MSQDSQPAPAPAPSLGCISAAHRALAVTEILNIIFSFGTQASNVSNVLVCRGWREPALDNVWREVDDIYYLLQLLAPFKTSDHGHRLVNFYVLCSRRTQPLKHSPLSGVFPHSNPRGLDTFLPLRSPCAFSQVQDQRQ
jgi:hypothetical protein